MKNSMTSNSDLCTEKIVGYVNVLKENSEEYEYEIDVGRVKESNRKFYIRYIHLNKHIRRFIHCVREIKLFH